MIELRSTSVNLEHGFSLFEVLITVVVISIGLLGLAGLQFVGMRAANSAQEYTYASLLAQDVEERIRANAGIDYHAVSIAASSANCVIGPCSPTQMRSFDASQWYYMLNGGGDNTPVLANGSIELTGGGNAYTVTIKWGDPSGPQTLTTSFTVQ